MRRETMFECVLESADGEYRVFLRAWSAAEAEARFREKLEAEGVAVREAVRVRASGGADARRITPQAGQRGSSGTLRADTPTRR